MKSKMKPIVLMADHGGVVLKEQLRVWLESEGVKIHDVGTNSEASVDFPIIVARGVKAVKQYGTVGIFVCGSGIGVSMAANRFKGIRAALVHNEIYAQLSRQHNDANVICLGGRFLSLDDAKRIVAVYLETEFLGGKYETRNKMLDA